MVIVDTNVFYDLDSGVIAKAWFENHCIVGTMLSQMELAKSPNLIDNFSKVKGAARAMNHHCDHIISSTPPEFMIRRFIPNYEANPMLLKNIRESFNLLLNPNFNLRVDRETAKQLISDYEKPWTDIRLKENRRLLNIRTAEETKHLYKNEEFRTSIKKHDFINSTKKDIVKGLQDYHLENYPNQPLNIDENDDGWNDLEFLLNVWTDYDKRFFEKQMRTVKRNDFMDIAITAYVGRNDLYWTNDKDFIDIMKSNPITQKYLHPLCGRKR